MNKSKFITYNASDVFVDDQIYLYYSSSHGFKAFSKKGTSPPPPSRIRLHNLSNLQLDRISEANEYISKHNNNLTNNNDTNLNPASDHLPFTNHRGEPYENTFDCNSKFGHLLEKGPQRPLQILKEKMSLIAKDANGIVEIQDEIGDNLSAVLREKMPNNDILYNDSGKWLCGDYNEKSIPSELKGHGASAYRIVNGNRDNKFVERNNPKRKFRTRSESEPHELAALNSRDLDWSKQASLSVTDRNSSKIENPLATKLNNVDERRAKLPATPKRHSPARVLLYSTTPSPRSPRHLLQGSNRHPSSPLNQRRGSSMTRLYDYRRSRTKSPSLSRMPSEDSVAEYEVSRNSHDSRKAKSVTPRPGYTNLVKSKAQEKPSPTRLLEDRRSSCSSIEDDYDISDREYDVHDHSLESGFTSSDSDEDGYRSHAYKNSHLDEKLLMPGANLNKSTTAITPQCSEESLVNPQSFLVPSLFPNVPPYLAFSSNTQRGPDVPPELYKILKWKVTNVMPKLVRHVLANSGVRLLKKTNDWMGTWGKHMKSPCFKTIRPCQKINHLPGSFKIGRKDACWKNLQRLTIKYGKKEFGFMPKTYIMPLDLNYLRKSWPKYAQRNTKWIIKPPASARGTGIRVVNRWAQIPKRKPLIVQRYIERPLLINGSKFDLRLYVLVTSINPLRVYMYHNGLARFASVKYSAKIDTLNERCMHLTNYSINKLSSNYHKNEDVNACHGHKWTLKSLWKYLETQGVHTDLLWDALRNLVMRTILAGEHAINSMVKGNVESKYSCFELFGFDVLLDAELVPWLLEVNISPSLHSELPLDEHVKAPLVQGVLNTALYNIPPRLSPEEQKAIGTKLGFDSESLCFDKRIYVNYLSRAEKVKHNTYTRKSLEDRDEYINSILEHLTPDDVRCLIVAEDELARCAPLERIFPTCETYKYLKYTEVPRYYNRLLDAWETRYSNNREAGIKLLQEYCEQKYHLEVPPSPTRKAKKFSCHKEIDYTEKSSNISDIDIIASNKNNPCPEEDSSKEFSDPETRTLISMTRSTLALTSMIRSIRRKNRRHMLRTSNQIRRSTLPEENDDTDDSENEQEL